MLVKYCLLLILTFVYWTVVNIREVIFRVLEFLDSFPTPSLQSIDLQHGNFAPYDVVEPIQVSAAHLKTFFNVGVVVSLGFESLLVAFFNKEDSKSYTVKRFRYEDVVKVSGAYSSYKSFLKTYSPKGPDTRPRVFESMIEDLTQGPDKLH